MFTALPVAAIPETESRIVVMVIYLFFDWLMVVVWLKLFLPASGSIAACTQALKEGVVAGNKLLVLWSRLATLSVEIQYATLGQYVCLKWLAISMNEFTFPYVTVCLSHLFSLCGAFWV